MKTSSLLFLVFFCFWAKESKAQQDLYDLESSKKFAAYLLASGQYDFAAKEYERVLFLAPQNGRAQVNLLKSYRLAEDFDTGLLRGGQLFPNLVKMPEKQALEYSKLLLNTRNWEELIAFGDNNESLKPDDKTLLKSTVFIFDSEFINAREQLLKLTDSTNYLGQGYISVVDRAIDGKRKSPFLAGFLSMVVPGLGKTYAGDWKDGIVSLIFTGGMAFQAYRKFNQFGSNNFRPWLYTTLASGFYFGNVYGSVKSAKDRNHKRINLLQHEASDLYNSYY